MWFLEEIEGRSAGSAPPDEMENDEVTEDEYELESTSASEHFQQNEHAVPWPIPENVEHHVWPRHLEDYSVEDTITWLCARSRQLGHLQGKRVIRLTQGQYMLAVFVNNLVYKLEANPDGSLDPSIVRSLLTSVGAESQLDSVASYDLVLAVVVAHFRRQTEEPEELRIQEVLRNLLMAKALGRGQGRRHALRKSILGLLWRHPRLRGKISHVCRAGSVALALDTSSSDHDIILCLKDGGVNMVEELHQVILDLKKTCHRERLRRAEVVKKDFAVEIKNFYRHVDFDLVPVTLVEGHTGEQQWDVQRQVWQALLHPRLAPKLQQLSEEHPDVFFALRLMKIWNESMDYRRGKPPLVTLHIPLLTLGAWQQGYFKECRFVQDLGLLVADLPVHRAELASSRPVADGDDADGIGGGATPAADDREVRRGHPTAI
ncbi:unnamed protein product [Durusdinium trenchii]|uniref:Uncharacterized protein n=1 Tax=Durusdinium trenchii TaxID=1381693 RepID=A0ABP0LL58_9DINO